MNQRLPWWCGIVVLWFAGCSLRALVNDPLPPVSPSFITKRFTVAELRAELADVVEIVEVAEPTPYMFVSRESIVSRMRSLSAQITRPLTRYEFLPFLLELRAAYRIAHGTVLLPLEDFNDYVARGGRLASFAARREGDKILIARVEPQIGSFAAGDELLAINGHDAAPLVDRIRAAMPDDGNKAFGDDKLDRNFGHWLWAFGVNGPFRLTIKRGSLVFETTEVGMRPPRMLTLKERFLTKAKDGVPEREPFSLRVTPAKVAILEVTAFNPLFRERWREFLVSTFSRLQRQNIRGLVIDIRENTGGDSREGDELLRYVTDRPYRTSGGKLWRRSERYDAFIRAAFPWWVRWLPYERWFLGREFTEIGIGQTRWFAGKAAPPTATKLRFIGRVAVLTGPRTFSAAASFADAVKSYRLATLIGESPGGINGFAAEVALTRLPRTRLAIAICSARSVRANGDPNDLSPTKVDIAVTSSSDDRPLARAIEFVLTR
ncbi:MAG: S41 family peptidase [Kofleriaceae bacterium]